MRHIDILDDLSNEQLQLLQGVLKHTDSEPNLRWVIINRIENFINKK